MTPLGLLLFVAFLGIIGLVPFIPFLLGRSHKTEERFVWDKLAICLTVFGVFGCTMGLWDLGRYTVFGVSELSLAFVSGLLLAYIRIDLTKPQAWHFILRAFVTIAYVDSLSRLFLEPHTCSGLFLAIALSTIAVSLTISGVLIYYAFKNHSH